MGNSKILNKKIVITFILVIVIILTESMRMDTGKVVLAAEKNLGAGHGIIWPEHVFAPYVDMAAWVTQKGYSNNGSLNLKRVSQDTGVKFFHLGFIQASSHIIKNKKIQWGWGGYQALSEKGKWDPQYLGLKRSIKELRSMGGDVCVSFGGGKGIAFWQVTSNVAVLANTYREIISVYGLTRIDFDIEGAAQNRAKNAANAKALKIVQDETGVEVILTLPVSEDGLDYQQLLVLEAYLESGVEIEILNLMTMCYGRGSLSPGVSYGTASVKAIDAATEQLKKYYRQYLGISLSEDQAFSKIGTTTNIGFSSYQHPVFTKKWARLVVNHADKKQLGMVSFWEINKDAMLVNNLGIHAKYEFTKIYKGFGGRKLLPAESGE
ncbi:glycoside hydrolase family 18 protein [Anaeromicropila populeti]|uniref:Chitinase n=1 Tax=Anaeromicropila populeti TaxID=37658 RepID=A0A1I6K639_9FIRM|nr:hypothetical protein [Anaeromicropila populeti]SFR86725.1 chitinase [Anaeromicropila populeti]